MRSLLLLLGTYAPCMGESVCSISHAISNSPSGIQITVSIDSLPGSSCAVEVKCDSQSQKFTLPACSGAVNAKASSLRAGSSCEVSYKRYINGALDCTYKEPTEFVRPAEGSGWIEQHQSQTVVSSSSSTSEQTDIMTKLGGSGNGSQDVHATAAIVLLGALLLK